MRYLIMLNNFMTEVSKIVENFVIKYNDLPKDVIDHFQLRRHPFLPELSFFCSPKLLFEIQNLVYNQGHSWHWFFLSEGSIGLARYIIDNPNIVKGKVVYDLGTGQGAVALASKFAGAKIVHAIDIEKYSGFAIDVNSYYNNLEINFECKNLLDINMENESVILASDIWYNQDRCDEISTFLYEKSKTSTVIMSQPLRTKYKEIYTGIHHTHLQILHNYEIPCFTPFLEATSSIQVNLYNFRK